MALEAAFKKQLKKKRCLICGENVPFGIFTRHVNSCISDPDDEDCKVLQILTADDKKRIAIENTITLNDSGFPFGSFEAKTGEISEVSEVSENIPQSDQQPTSNASDNKAKPISVTVVTSDEAHVDVKKDILIPKPESICSGQSEQKESKVLCKSNTSVVPSDLLTRKRSAKIDLQEKISKKAIKKRPDTGRVAYSSSTETSGSINVKEERSYSAVFVKVDCVSSVSSTSTPKLPETKPKELKTLDEVVEDIHKYLKVCDCTIVRGRVFTHIPQTDEPVEEEQEHFTSPYYLVLFNHILVKVFGPDNGWERQRLISFWGEKLRYIHGFISLSTASQKLLIRLFLRKRSWLSAGRLRYSNIASNLVPLFGELMVAQFVDSSDSFEFELEDAIGLLQAPSLKNIAKKFKVDFSLAKEELAQRLIGLSRQKSVFGLPIAGQILKAAKQEMGSCFRLREDVVRFISCVFTLFSPVDMSSSLLLDQPNTNLASQLLFVMLELKLEKIRFPAPTSPSLLNIYESYPTLCSYVDAKLLESEIAYLMFKGQWHEVVKLSTKAREKFEDLFDKNRSFCEKLPQHLRHHTDCWVYTRCISHGIEAYQRLRQYDEAVKLLRYLLFSNDFKMFLINARGSWWDRLALNLDSHLKNKAEAFEVIKEGLGDPSVGDKDRLLLQERGMKLSKIWKGPLQVFKPQRMDIDGVTLGKALGDQRANYFTTQRNGKHYQCPVEEVALDYYIEKEGYKEGVHAEGSVWHFIFGLLCYDIIFDHDVKNVWFSETQTHPSDLNTKLFYTERKLRFDKRFREIEDSKTKDLIKQITPVYEKHYGETNSEMSWECLNDLEQVKRFMQCCRPCMLAAVFRRLTTDYRNCRSGFPDLTLWNAVTKKLAVVEVKGPGDKLSTKQILWLQYFKEQKVEAQVCHVAACNPKRMGS